jgi:hypothetical protein
VKRRGKANSHSFPEHNILKTTVVDREISFFSFEKNIYHPEYAIFQGGLISK